MKKKLDFVTNSSSVSYVGWGVHLSEEDIKNELFIKKCFENYKLETWADQNKTIEEFKENDIKEISDYASSNILKFSTGSYGENYFILGSPDNMKDDQTLKEFKDQIIKELSEYGIKVDSLEYIEECWRDG
jgi:hypothetical protein